MSLNTDSSAARAGARTATSHRVLFDMRVAAYRAGGIGRYAREMHHELTTQRRAGLRITALRAPRDAMSVPGSDDLVLRTPAHHRLERRALPLELRLHRTTADVLHATDFIVPVRSKRIAAQVATIHDLSFVHWPHDLAPDGLDYYQQLQQSLADTDMCIVPSDWTRRDLMDVYGVTEDRIAVIPHGADQEQLSQPVVPRERRGGFVLAVGTVEPRKRYGLLLDALASRANLPTLVVAGQAGWNSIGIEQRLRDTPGVTWLADADDSRIRALYREAIAVLLPTRAEGFGLPALEAMAAGTPVISSGGGALPEVTGDAALTVAAPDPGAWADAIRTLQEDAELWEQLSRAGRLRARSFSWAVAADATAEVYRQAVRAVGILPHSTS